jgi:hypothetical protein
MQKKYYKTHGMPEMEDALSLDQLHLDCGIRGKIPEHPPSLKRAPEHVKDIRRYRHFPAQLIGDPVPLEADVPDEVALPVEQEPAAAPLGAELLDAMEQ